MKVYSSMMNDSKLALYQFNVRLAEGGAALVALDLHNRSLKRGYASKFIYGYGKGLKNSHKHNAIEGAVRASSKASVLLNYGFHSLFNYDLFGKPWTLLDIKHDPIVIHLHVIHSHWFNLFQFAEFLSYAKRRQSIKVVWSLHDHWSITGRCAFLDNCSRHTIACKSCPKKSNYPPVLYDNARNIFKSKRITISRLINLGVEFVSPSHHVSVDFETAYGHNCHVINNSIDLETENIISLSVSNRKNLSGINTSIVAHDLSYQAKVNPVIVKAILQISSPDFTLHLFGKNSPYINAPSVCSYGYVSSKKLLMQYLACFDSLIFTSSVDNYPLILCEALSLGLPVLCTQSAASSEILGAYGISPLSFKELIRFAMLPKKQILTEYYQMTEEELIHKSYLLFNGSNTLSQYLRLYHSV